MNLRSSSRFMGATILSVSLLGVVAIETTASAATTPAAPAACKTLAPEVTNVVETINDGPTSQALDAVAEVKDSLESAPGASARTEAKVVNEALKDDSLFLDRCGELFVAEEGMPQYATSGPSGGSTIQGGYAPLDQTFNLSSRPGADRTIFLDFRGQTVTNTAWNKSYGTNIVSAPLSLDSSSAFSDSEKRIVQEAWAVMADDFAAWDVNVTTKTPTADQLNRSSSSDNVYGLTAMVSNKNTIAAQCGCGGVAYVGVSKNSTSNGYYAPAWVFSDKLGNNGKSIGEAASHEIGHNLGLGHDGTASVGYYSGSNPWAPIMGVGYNQPLSQWSKGEYAGANNQQDDIAIIGSTLPVLDDPHPNAYTDANVPTLATSNASPSVGTLKGVITSGSDRDVVKVTASGGSTFSVAPDGYQPNLDLGLILRSSTGEVVASSNPTAAASSRTVATGLNAAFDVTLPDDPRDYFLEIFPVGQKTPSEAGGYSTYGSLGAWTATAKTSQAGNPLPAPVSFSMASSYQMEVGKPVSSQYKASGGNGKYTWKATGLPSGLKLSSTGKLTGTPTKAQSTTIAITATSGTSPSTVAMTKKATAKVASRLAWKTSSTLSSAYYKKSFSRTIYITGGVPNYRYSFSGSWPKGTKIHYYQDSTKNYIKLSGTPTARGTYKFKVNTSDKLGMKASKYYYLKVR